MNLTDNGKAESAEERENEKLITNGPKNVCEKRQQSARGRLRDFM